MAQSNLKEIGRTRPPEVRVVPGITPAARLMDRVGRWVIAVGGIGVIVVVMGIFVFVIRESYPLFLGAEVEALATVDLSAGGEALAVGVDPYREVAFVVRPGGVDFISLESGEVLLRERPEALAGKRIVSAYRAPTGGYLGLGTEDGRMLTARVDFSVSYPEGARTITPGLSVEGQVRLDEDGEPIVAAAYRSDGAGRETAVGVTASGRVVMAAIERRRGLLGGGRTETFVYDLTGEIDGRPTAVLADVAGRNVLVGTDRGEIFRFDVSDPRVRPRRTQRFQAAEPGVAVSSLDYLLGDVSAVVGDAAGNVSTWFPVRQVGRPDFKPYRRAHTLQSRGAPIRAIAPSGRDKQFLTGDAEGGVALHHMTSEQTFFRVSPGRSEIDAVVFAPKADGFLCLDVGGNLTHYRLHNPHPEVTLETLFGRVWYESYQEPEYVWQSTGGSDDFEPKLSIMPLAYGTAKGTFYAMLFALPLAVLAALYTSEFAHPRVRALVKPVVELMASLPSVILGFLGGLWLAPLLEREVAGALILFPMVPTVVILAAWAWQRLPGRAVRRLPDQGEVALLIPVTFLAVWAAFVLGPSAERALFGGNFQRWLLGASGTQYDQRNCLVVGFAMGFAVIPIIYTICEDALSSVPSHLRAGSLALGATPWQTAIRVVLPTASPGIFSAAMIGFGRAVGETMIVLMATGNTPIMDWSIFNGMRTLSANIAVEIPEAPHEGTLYRVLFLTGLLLTAVTFLVNTAAEVVRQRLRERYSRI